MIKKQNTPIWLWIVVGVLILIFFNQNGVIEIPVVPGTIVDPSLEETLSKGCSISLDKYGINSGELARGTIYYYPFANCEMLFRIGWGIWTSMGTYQLDKNGEFYYETPVNVPGTYEIIGICTSREGSCKTNIEILTVFGIGDSDGDGFKDQDEIDAGTDPNNPNDFPQEPDVDDGFYSFQECGNLAGNSFYWRTGDGSDWTFETCQAYADSRCNAVSSFLRNCCWWNCISQTTEGVTHGGFMDCTDCLNNYIMTIINVKQGGTYYTETTDYFLNNGCIDWSPGGLEPAIGSTYEVIYNH